MSEERAMVCEMCGCPIVAGHQWLLLNRYGVGDGSSHVLVESKTDDDHYEWDGEADTATGLATHWPACSTMFIDGAILEVGVLMRGQDRAK